MTNDIQTVLEYHERTKHHVDRYARSLGYMDWATQPDPFRRYEGAPTVVLDEISLEAGPRYDRVFELEGPAPRDLDHGFISQLFYDSLSLSAWKVHQDSRWSLRVNPSSGNLHPTEAYLVAGAIPGVHERPSVSHYQAFEHVLERRTELPAHAWGAVAQQLPRGSVLVGLTSIYWRESWKYGERAFRYCQHDAGHAIGALTIAAAVLGFEARLLESVLDEDLAVLLGVRAQEGIEAEHPDCVLVLYPRTEEFSLDRQRSFHVPADLLETLEAQPWAGQPNGLSRQHHAWPIIDQVSGACRRSERPNTSFWAPRPGPRPAPLSIDRPIGARQVIRQRRSAVAMDGATTIGRDQFYRIMQRADPGLTRMPFAVLPWRPFVHLVLFVHRVEGLVPGLYLLVRAGDETDAIRASCGRPFAWERAEACPPGLDLFLLAHADCRDAARTICCHQDIAADGCFAVGMLARYEDPIREHGPWMYKRLFWETGVVGQVLYLEAEAASTQTPSGARPIRSTGIGCYFDDALHRVLGIRDRRFQSLYHFTVGGPVEDPRLQTHPAYAHRG